MDRCPSSVGQSRLGTGQKQSKHPIKCHWIKTSARWFWAAHPAPRSLKTTITTGALTRQKRLLVKFEKSSDAWAQRRQTIYFNIITVLSEWRGWREQAWICLCFQPTSPPSHHHILLSLTVLVLNNESFVLSEASTCSLSLQLPLTHTKTGKNSQDSKPIMFADDSLMQIQLLRIRRIN